MIAAEQQRHDRAHTRALIILFAVLVIGGGLALFIQFGPLLRGRDTLQAILESAVFAVPLLAAFIQLCRVPPLPFESLGDIRRDLDKKEKEWRVILISQVFIFTMLAVENLWIWPRMPQGPIWPFGVIRFVPTILMVFIPLMTLYTRPGWMNPDLRPLLDDEVTWSFRARAQRLGYLLMLFIALGFCLAAEIDVRAAARWLPLGLAVGTMLPVLYFVYLDWQATRGG
ncbi:MAG TPA: hypothetical protein VHZ32_11675 [Rhizomicrobium sp.]|nr:hypothetical protein [Rhizomicrobium sp.]